MAGLFKTILDSTNNIIRRNPKVQEQFDLPYLLHRDTADWHGDEGSLALCKLMPLDNDTYDVKMPSHEARLGHAQMDTTGITYFAICRGRQKAPAK